jgi:serine phosphatase RsbU (regulator of sigma subunit)
MEITHNPYLNRAMIRDISDFYGRKREIARIYSRIGTAHPQSVSIVGTRRIGKSSLLNFIYQEANREKYLKNPQQYKFIFIDFQERKKITLPEFFSALFELLLREFHGQLDITESPSYEGLKEIVTRIQQKGLKLIFLFDEFDSITQNPNFDMEFFAFLRALASRYDVACVVSSGRRLQELCHTKEIADSPFFNIFTTLHLGPFTYEEAMELISIPSEKAGIPLEPHSDFLLEVAGTFPFFLQIACCALFEHLQSGGTMDEMGQMGVQEIILEEAESHFQYIWDRLDEPKRRVCHKIARGEPIPPSDRTELRELTQQGCVIMKSDGPALFSSLFAEQVEVMETEREMAHIRGDYVPEAIVLIDICGSTKIAHRYGAHLLQSIYRNLEGMANEVASRFHDRYRVSTGDGLLLTFNKVEDAIYFCIEIQRRIREHNSAVDVIHRIPVRFVIHFGETLTDETGHRCGDTINMTFKVESIVSDVLVDSGEYGLPSYDYIIVTEHVARELASNQRIPCRELGAFELPGLTGLHRLYELQAHQQQALFETPPQTSEHLERIERIEQELQDAQAMQRSILPSEEPIFPGLDISSYFRPATEIGGDYYDYLPLTETKLGVAIGDVKGHGMPAGLLVSTASGSLHTTLETTQSIAEVMSVMNRRVCEVKGHMFMTFCFSVMDTANLTLTLSSAGHPSPYHYRAATGAFAPWELGSLPLGVMQDCDFPVYSHTIEKDDVLVYYSDGLVEGTNAESQLFGFERLENVIIQHAHQKASDIKEAILTEFFTHCQQHEQEDDVTLIIIKFSGAP